MTDEPKQQQLDLEDAIERAESPCNPTYKARLRDGVRMDKETRARLNRLWLKAQRP